MNKQYGKTLQGDQAIHNFLQELFQKARDGDEVSQSLLLLLKDKRALKISVETKATDNLEGDLIKR